MKRIANATLVPLYRPEGLVVRTLTRYGLYDGSGRAIRGWPVLTSLDTTYPFQWPRLRHRAETRRKGQAIYGGLIFGWFGHFITESVPNLLAVAAAKAEYPDAPIIAHAHGTFDPAEWKVRHKTHLRYFFDRLGLDLDDLHFARAPTEIEDLILPPPAFEGKFRYAPWVVGALDRYWPKRDHGPSLYLSRLKLDIPRIYNEAEAESLFAEYGYDTVYPEELTLPDQLALLGSAPHLAGTQGSALHWSLYAPICTSMISMGYPSPLQKGICRARNQRYIELRGRRKSLRDGRLRDVSLDEMRKTLDRLHS